MAITSFILRYNSNDFEPKPAGDLIEVIYDVVIEAGENTYPAGGEPVDFSGEFAEVHSVVADLGIAAPTFGQADAVGAMIPVFQRDPDASLGLNTGAIRLYRGPDAVANLPELPAGEYPNDVGFILTVHGRPITDSF